MPASSAAFRIQVLTLGLLVVPVLWDLSTSLKNRPFGYVAADTFYYLVVARNMALHGLVSFDGQFLSNGFHPLWQFATGILYALARALGLERQIVTVVVLACLALVALSVWFLSLALLRARGRLTPAFAIVPFGAYAMLAAPFYRDCRAVQQLTTTVEGPLPLFGTLWSYVNGMESGAVLLCYGVLALLYTKSAEPGASKQQAIRFGAWAGALTLARLDHALLVVPIVAGYAARGLLEQGGVKSKTIPTLLAFVIPVGGYLLVSRLVFGSALPVSGAAKSSFPIFTTENLELVRALLSGRVCGAMGAFFREAQIVVPVLAAVFYLALAVLPRVADSALTFRLRPSCSSFDGFLILSALGVILLGAYNFLFTGTYHQGHWYFPVSTLFVSLALVSSVERFRLGPNVWLVRAALSGLVALSGWVFVTLVRVPEYNAKYAEFYWKGANEVRAHYQGKPPAFIEIDDGIVGFALGSRTMSNALALDVEGARAAKEKRLMKLAAERGITRVASFAYCNLPSASPGPGSCASVAGCLSESLAGYTCEVEYVQPNGRFAVQRVIRAGSETKTR